MDIGRVLARSLEITWRYKILWVFGFIMALTSGNGGSSGLRYDFSGNNFRPGTNPPNTPFSPPQIPPGIIIGVLAMAACLFVLFLVLTLYFRFVARGALVTYVRNVEQGTSPTLGAAWREGQRYYGRLLGLGFLFNVPLLLFSIVVVAIAVIPFIGTIIAAVSRSAPGQTTAPDIAPIISGVFAFIGLICCAVVCLVVVSLVLHPIYEFAVRGIVLEESGISDGIRRGYSRLRMNIGPVGLLYLLLIGARLLYTVVLGVFALPFAFLLAAAVAFAGSIQSPVLIIFLALIIGLPLALIFLFLEGLFQVFESNAWTEGYMALLAPTLSTAPAPPRLESPATA